MDYRDEVIALYKAECGRLKAKNRVLLAALEDCLKLDDIAPAVLFESIHAQAREVIAQTKGGE